MPASMTPPASPVPGASHRHRRRLVAATAGAFALGLLGTAVWRRREDAGTVIEERETPFGRLAVIERDRRRFLAYGAGREIVYQSVIDLDRPHELAAPYMQLMMLAMVYAEPAARQVHIGVGAGNMVGYLMRTFPGLAIDAVDIDAQAVELGARHFGLAPQPGLRIHIDDGRRWLQGSASRFDVAMLDAYDDRSIPPALADEGFFALVAAHLADGGVAMQNVYLPSVDLPRLLAAMRPSLPHVDAYRHGDSLVLAARRAPAPDAAALAARARSIDAALRPAHPLGPLLARRVEA